jgi:hypothetical protein
VILDMTTSVVALGKIHVARNRGQSVPAGWILDMERQQSTEPDDYLKVSPWFNLQVITGRVVRHQWCNRATHPVGSLSSSEVTLSTVCVPALSIFARSGWTWAAMYRVLTRGCVHLILTSVVPWRLTVS